MSRPSRYSNVFHLGHRRCELGLHSFIINLGVDEGFVNILAAGDTPIIILSVRDEEASIVLGLDLGADDYLTKPFRLRELISRMKAVLRRRGPVEAGDRTLACGDVTVVTQPLRLDMVVLQIGINDLTAVSLFPEETASRVVQCQNNLRQLVSQATAGGASVILTTIFPAGYLRLGYREFGLSEIGPLVIEVNNYLTILASPQVILFDAYTLLSENGLVKGEYSLDLLHLNSAGYDALSQSLTPLLLNLAQTRAAG